MKSKTKFPRGISKGFSPVSLFALGCGANALLAYTPVPLILKIAVFCLAIAYPLGRHAFLPLADRSILPPWKASLFTPPGPAWMLLFFALAASVRWFAAARLTVWPIYDNGFMDYFAWKISQGWDHHLFYGFDALPIGYLGILSFFHRLVEPSLDAFWIYGSLFSILFLGAAYGVSRFFLGRSFSFLIFFLLAFSFWPLLVETMSPLVDLMSVLECLLVAGLLAWHRADSSDRKSWAVALGILMAAGYYFGFAIPFSAFLGFWLLIQVPRKGAGSFFIFSAVFLCLVSPWALHFFQSTMGGKISQGSIFASTRPLGDRLRDSFSYLTALFWGTWNPEAFRFTSFWGGLWNPILGSALFLGMSEAVRFRRLPEAGGCLLAFGFLLLPGLLSGDQEMLRIAYVLPVGLWFAGAGFQKLLSALPAARRLPVLALLLGLSGSLDAYQMLGPYRQWQVPSAQNWEFKSAPKFAAYQILKDTGDRLGPGWVFTEFVSDDSGGAHLPDQTLRMACYPFNALENRKRSASGVHWAGLLANADYGPFLQKRFPAAQWYSLAPEVSLGYGGLLLGIIPFTPANSAVLQSWLAPHASFERINSILLGYHPYSGARDAALKAMAQVQPQFHQDPFLESCLFEKVLQCFLENGNQQAARQALLRARNAGYPCVLWDRYSASIAPAGK